MIRREFVARGQRVGNSLTPEGATNVALIYQRLHRLPYFNLPAFALMELAHDLHAHGSPKENELAEMILCGVARGLGVAMDPNHEYPRCPDCGKRHPPNAGVVKLLQKLMKEAFGSKT